MSNQLFTPDERASQQTCTLYSKDHNWQPTIILGYYQCNHCQQLAACVVCIPKLRGKPMPGYCQHHHHLRTPESAQEVLG